MRASVLFWRDYLRERRDEWWQVAIDGVPEDVIVHKIIAMDESVTHADDLWPWNRTIAGLDIAWNLAGSLANELVSAKFNWRFLLSSSAVLPLAISTASLE